MMKISVVLALIAVLTNCTPSQPAAPDSESSAPDESTPQTSTSSGVTPQTPASSGVGVLFSLERVGKDSIRLALDNGAPHPIGYNLCPSVLERRSGASWTQVPSDDVCTMQLMTLNPGHDATFEKRLPQRLEAGEYRYVTSVESPLGSEQSGVSTKPFQLP